MISFQQVIHSRAAPLLLLLSIVSLQLPQQTLAKKSSGSRNIPLLDSSSFNMEDRRETAKALAALEQSVDDVNAQWIAASATAGQAASYRRLIAMPLTDMFDPPMGAFSHGHSQTGDKMSLPKVFGDAILLNKAEVPWLFEVKRVDGVTGPRVEYGAASDSDSSDKDDGESGISSKQKKKKAAPSLPTDVGAAPSAEALDSVVGGPLDFRAPPNYIFLPWWMMRALGLRPRDVVDVQQITTIPAGSMVKFRPLTAQTMLDMENPQAVLETELRHYSSLTKGSTIAFDYNKKRYWFEVAECRSAPRGEKKPMVKVQDCDVASDFMTAKDTMAERKRKKLQQLKEQAESS